MLPSLGWREQEKVWNDAKSIYEYQAGDNSQLILLYGVATLYLTFMFIIVWREAVKSSYKSELLAKAGKHLNTFKEDFKSLFDQNLQEDAGETKDQASGSKFIKVYGKSR